MWGGLTPPPPPRTPPLLSDWATFSPGLQPIKTFLWQGRPGDEYCGGLPAHRLPPGEALASVGWVSTAVDGPDSTRGGPAVGDRTTLLPRDGPGARRNGHRLRITADPLVVLPFGEPARPQRCAIAAAGAKCAGGGVVAPPPPPRLDSLFILPPPSLSLSLFLTHAHAVCTDVCLLFRLLTWATVFSIGPRVLRTHRV